MHSISFAARIWRRRLLTVCIVVSLWAAIARVGSPSGIISTAMAPGSANNLTADPQTYEILGNSCFDCHSDRGSGSWSARLAPSYLFGARKGRNALNFSNWATLGVKERSAMASLIAAVVNNGSMPPGDYDFFHPSSRLNDNQKKLVLQWTSQQIAAAAH